MRKNNMIMKLGQTLLEGINKKHISKWILFAISNFAITDEIPSESGYLSLPSIDSSKAKQAAPGSDLSV